MMLTNKKFIGQSYFNKYLIIELNNLNFFLLHIISFKFKLLHSFNVK